MPKNPAPEMPPKAAPRDVTVSIRMTKAVKIAAATAAAADRRPLAAFIEKVLVDDLVREKYLKPWTPRIGLDHWPRELKETNNAPSWRIRTGADLGQRAAPRRRALPPGMGARRLVVQAKIESAVAA
jgi:hypothetical protein